MSLFQYMSHIHAMSLGSYRHVVNDDVALCWGRLEPDAGPCIPWHLDQHLFCLQLGRRNLEPVPGRPTERHCPPGPE